MADKNHQNPASSSLGDTVDDYARFSSDLDLNYEPPSAAFNWTWLDKAFDKFKNADSSDMLAQKDQLGAAVDRNGPNRHNNALMNPLTSAFMEGPLTSTPLSRQTSVDLIDLTIDEEDQDDFGVVEVTIDSVSSVDSVSSPDSVLSIDSVSSIDSASDNPYLPNFMATIEDDRLNISEMLYEDEDEDFMHLSGVVTLENCPVCGEPGYIIYCFKCSAKYALESATDSDSD